MMKENLPGPPASGKDKIITLLLLIPALFCLCLGVYYWVRLVGIFPGDTWRFDLMPWYWRVLACSLAVVYPIAACGLWTASRWGIILWLACALFETCAYSLYSSYFGKNWRLIALHGGFLIFYAVLCYCLRLHDKKRDIQAVAEY